MIDRELLIQVLQTLDDVISYNEPTGDGPAAERWKRAAGRMNKEGGQVEYVKAVRAALERELEVGAGGTQWFMDLPSEHAQGEAIGICGNLDMHVADFKSLGEFLRAVRFRIIDMLDEIHEKG